MSGKSGNRGCRKGEGDDDWLIQKQEPHIKRIVLCVLRPSITHIYTYTYLLHEHQRNGGQQGDDRHDGELVADRADATLQPRVRIHEFFGVVAYQKMYQMMERKGEDLGWRFKVSIC